MSFILPASSRLLGSTFDLHTFDFRPFPVYDFHAISSLTQTTEINTITAEYTLTETHVELRKFFGIGVATRLKALVHQYDYKYTSELQQEIRASTADEFYLALKINLRLVKETIPRGTPKVSDWESGAGAGCRIGTHYVKSIIYGSEVFLIFSLSTRISQHTTALKEALLTAVDRSGTLDESFKEKFNAFLQGNIVDYRPHSFGSVAFATENPLPENVDDMLALKNKYHDLVNRKRAENEVKWIPIFYEMKPLSHLSPRAPLIKINRDILKTLEDVEWKFEDLRFASDLLPTFKPKKDLAEEDKIMIQEFDQELLTAYSDMIYAIKNMDISTAGSINQFSTALKSYGNANDTNKYRKKVEFILLQFSETIDNYSLDKDFEDKCHLNEYNCILM